MGTVNDLGRRWLLSFARLPRPEQVATLEALPRGTRERLEASLGLRVWAPIAGPQEQARDSLADVVGFGGSGGGGKSFLQLGLAMTRHRRSLILRRESVQTRGFIEEVREKFYHLGRLNENTGVWRLHDGRVIEFSGVKDIGDVQKHKGRPKDLLAVDEADQFPESVIRYLMGWVRSATEGQRCRTILCFNPPASAEGRWVLSYFGPWLDPKHPRPAQSGELRWYAMVAEASGHWHEVERPDGQPFEQAGERITPKSRTFIPARVTDNPYLTATDYAAQLQALPEPLRSQLLHGDFRAGLEDDPWQTIPTAWVEAAQARWQPGPPSGARLEAVGVDVARGGAAQTVLARRYGPWFAPLEKHPGASTPDGPSVVRLVAAALGENVHALVNVDAIGIGSSPVDWLRGLNVGVLHAVNFGAGTPARDKSGLLGFMNVRAYAYWLVRDLLDPASKQDLALPPDPELLADLTAVRWSVTPRGIKLEDKQEVAKRIGRSPDCADATVLSCLVKKG